jgi:transposase
VSRTFSGVAVYGNYVPRWKVALFINSLLLEGEVMTIVTVGIDLAKNVFAVHGVDESGKPALANPRVPRAKLLEMVAHLPRCRIGMEACSGGHHWAREFSKFGHDVHLIAAKFVTPYRMSGKRGKNDAADAAAICEAVTRPNMRFVPIKSVEQQSVLFLHRARQGYVDERTAIINRIRGLLSELGIVLPLKAATVRQAAHVHLEDLPGWCNTVVGDLLSELTHLDERIKTYDRYIAKVAKQDSLATSLMRLCGVGPVTASAIVATIGKAHDFACGRQFCAWLGLVPGQHSSGGKQRLGRITKAGDPYLRTLLVMGAKAVLQTAKSKNDTLSRWALAVQERRGYWKAVVAIAAKNARMCWAMLQKGDAFKMPA